MERLIPCPQMTKKRSRPAESPWALLPACAIGARWQFREVAFGATRKKIEELEPGAALKTGSVYNL